MTVQLIESWGLTIALELPPGTRPEELAAVLPPDARPGHAPTRVTISADDLDGLRRALREHVALHAPRHTFVHAGCVAVDGVALLLPGSTFAGKSTLVAALLRCGATYLSDEFAVLDDHGRVHPFPIPLAMRRPNSRDGRQWEVSPDVFGASVGVDPLPVRMIAALRYRPEAGWCVRDASAGEAALALWGNCVAARSDARRALARCVRAASAAACLCGTRADARDAAERLTEAMSRRNAPDDPWADAPEG